MINVLYWSNVARWAERLLFNEQIVLPRSREVQVRTLRSDLEAWLQQNAGAKAGEIHIQQVRDPRYLIFVLKFKR